TGSMILEQIVANEEFARESIEDLARGLGAMMRREEACLGFEDRGIRGVAATRRERAEQPIRCGASRVQRLRHRAESRLEARGLRSCEPERIQPLLFVELQQMRACNRGAESSERAGGMESAHIVLGADHRAEAAFELDAYDNRFEDIAAACAGRFREREDCG